MVTVPRRIAAITLAERVAGKTRLFHNNLICICNCKMSETLPFVLRTMIFVRVDEMGEQTGQSVGYQVRFNSNCSSEKTILTYCTTGVLLRILSMVSFTT